MDNINYQQQVASPMNSFVQGYAGGAAIRDDQQAQVQKQVALQQQAQQKQVLQSLLTNKNPTAEDYADATLLVPGMREQFKQSWEQRNTAQQQSDLSNISQLYSAVSSGKPEIAASIIDKQVAAMQASGADPRQVAGLKTQAQIIRDHPDFARSLFGLQLASLPGGDKILQSASTIGKEQREQDQAPADLAKKTADARKAETDAAVAAGSAPAQIAKADAEVANISSQIQDRVARLGLDQDKLATDTQIKLKEMKDKATTLDGSATKIVNDSSVAAITADQSAAQMLSLADQIDKAKLISGVQAKGNELYKSVTGNQNAVSALRQEYVRIRNSQAIKSLPPGPATDADIALALKGFPDDTADADVMAKFLRGMAKLSQREAVAESAKAEWVNSVGSLGKPKSDIEIDGIKVAAGTTYVDFMRKSLDRRSDARATEAKTEAVQARSYWRFAQPGAK